MPRCPLGHKSSAHAFTHVCFSLWPVRVSLTEWLCTVCLWRLLFSYIEVLEELTAMLTSRATRRSLAYMYICGRLWLDTPLVFSVYGSMGPTARVVYKKLAAMIASKHSQSYSQTINWLRCRLSFSLLQSCIMCLRGSRSLVNHPAVHPQIQEAAIEQALNNGRVATI